MNQPQNNYLDTLDWIGSLNQNKIVPGLERIKKLMNALGNPHNNLRLIIIGGTNAKGSTALNLNHNLTKAGLKSGCFTSPHLHSVRERIRIGEKIISQDDFTKVLKLLHQNVVNKQIRATYFEVLTAAAYYYFYAEKVDWAIMEVGLGGEWDAVNAGDAEVAILTTLGIDHVDYLGHRLEEIAKTKARIVRKGSKVITGWPEKYHKHIPRCESLSYGLDIEKWVKLAIEAIEVETKAEIIRIPGRYEKYDNFILDTAHNPQAIQFVTARIKGCEKIILGLMRDKDIEGIINFLPKKCEILACNLKTERSASSNKIAKLCRDLKYNFKEFNDVKKAIEYSRNHKTLITGSFHTVAEARVCLKLKGHSEL